HLNVLPQAIEAQLDGRSAGKDVTDRNPRLKTTIRCGRLAGAIMYSIDQRARRERLAFFVLIDVFWPEAIVKRIPDTGINRSLGSDLEIIPDVERILRRLFLLEVDGQHE